MRDRSGWSRVGPRLVGRDQKKGVSPICETPVIDLVVNYLFTGFIVELAGAVSFFALAAGVIAFAGFIVEELAELFAGATLVVAAGETALTVGAGVTVLAGLTAFVLFVLLAAGAPQAIPRALTPKTAESTNTFVILLRLLSFSKNIKSRFRGSADDTQPFRLELFLFQDKGENRNLRRLCQPKIGQKTPF